MKLSQQSHLVLADYQTNRFKVGGFPFEIKCWEPETHPLHLKKTDMIWQQLVHVQYENEDRLLPKIFLDVKIFNDLCYPWGDSLIIKLLGEEYRVYPDELSFECPMETKWWF